MRESLGCLFGILALATMHCFKRGFNVMPDSDEVPQGGGGRVDFARSLEHHSPRPPNKST
jgi:hypothetical protein